MFYIIELFSNDLQELFGFVVDTLSKHATISNIKEKNGRWSVSTQYFRLSVYVDVDREMFDKEDFDVKINTILWFDVIPASGYDSIIISLLKSILEEYSSDIIMFNTGYDALIVRKRGEIILGESSIPLVVDISSAIAEDEPC
ncbi:MAG TPA: hypothetical protein P5092_11475 [Ruminococcus sp.]|nr:hypothetical protein [Ruminococcus sp.]